jgi:hypothetical protein
MTKKEAKALDNILSRIPAKVGTIEVKESENKYCETLEALGYIEILSRDGAYTIQLTNEGNEFRTNSGFVKLRKAKHRKMLQWILPLIIAALGVLATVFF